MGNEQSYISGLSANTDKDGKRYSVRVETHPFETGTYHTIFKGQFIGEGNFANKNCIGKVLKREYKQRLKDGIPKNVEIVTKAQELASRFNKKQAEYANSSHPVHFPQKTLLFCQPFVVTMKIPERGFWSSLTDGAQPAIENNELVVFDLHLGPSFEKFTTNSGCENSLKPLLTAFSHWTWVVSDHQYLVCNLQGTEEREYFFLSDPSIHSIDKLYGKTDLGIYGMELVLGNHRCNSICRQLGLHNPLQFSGIEGKGPTTTFDFQLNPQDLWKISGKQSTFF